MINLSYILQTQAMKIFTLHCFCEYNKRNKKHFHLKVECHWLAIVSSIYYHRRRFINWCYLLSFSSVFILTEVIGNIFEAFAKKNYNCIFYNHMLSTCFNEWQYQSNNIIGIQRKYENYRILHYCKLSIFLSKHLLRYK